MTQTQYKTVSSKAATKHNYIAVTEFYRVELESEMLDNAIATFRGKQIALVSDTGGTNIQIWRKKDEVHFSNGARSYFA